MLKSIATVLLGFFLFIACSKQQEENTMNFTGAKNEVKLMTIDPGHFHAALVQKNMYNQVDPLVHIYAPEGPDVEDHMNRIEGFNNRAENPTQWKLELYLGPDYLEKMIQEKPGNVMVTAGNNRKKTEYIKRAVDAGINVLSDKPMCINKANFELLKQAFQSASQNDVLLYDIMTERYEITTILQRELSLVSDVFGQLQAGSVDEPAVTKESVHHFFKYVAGNPIKRPDWYFDVGQQGEGLVDVSTHLVDLIQWECFPEEPLSYESDIEMIKARRWPTKVSLEQFAKVTRLNQFSDFLKNDIGKDGLLNVYSNGDMVYKIKGIYAKVSVIWNFQAPEGTGDTHYSIMRGSKANLIIQQGEKENYIPELYVEPVGQVRISDLEKTLNSAVQNFQSKYPGIAMQNLGDRFQIQIPEKFRVGHEAHFGQVTEKYLQFLIDGELPDWEVPNMIAKYYTTTTALEMAKQ